MGLRLNSYEVIVSNFASPTLILSVPGSGKTYLLDYRVKLLLDNEQTRTR